MTEAIRKAVTLLPEWRKWEKMFGKIGFTAKPDEIKILIAALEDMQGVADGTHELAPLIETEAMYDAGDALSWKEPVSKIYQTMIDAYEEKS